MNLVHFMAKKTIHKHQIPNKFQISMTKTIFYIFNRLSLLFLVCRVRLSAAINTGRKLLIFFNSPFPACQASFISNKIIVTGAFAFP
jgi:hypothetical protein